MKKVTYLLGAGASCKAIPTVASFEKGLIDASNWLSNLLHPSYGALLGILSEEEKRFIQLLSDDLQHLSMRASNQSSVDTYAKMLFLANESEEYLRIKAILQSYIMFEQIAKKDYGYDGPMEFNIDKRYGLFISALAQKSPNGILLPENISIISWNYDSQLELLISQINKKSPEETAAKYNFYPSSTFDPASFHGRAFGVAKLNGSVSLAWDSWGGKLVDFGYRTEWGYYDTIRTLSRHHQFLRNHQSPDTPLFHFAWEEDQDFVIKAREYAKRLIANTDILVIIGYSFPYFNRIIDRDLLLSAGKLEAVYYQVPGEEYPGLKERIKAVSEDLYSITENIPDKEQFFIPYEI